ncbi:MAG TPA: ligase-associated DNA damage response endonuclease PdeM [Gemmatimonadaceae bacterium]|jgi:DNA ligase-associated metallophosphoesterase|nr:ligase-associated DNA damage response endonuclease PdeM [Gemmatimonadaceae bacterium]
MSATVTIAGETLELCAERAVYWPRRRTLLVADPHFGKAASFRALGVRVPRGTTEGALARLDGLVARLAPARIEFLGDFLHAREGRNDETFRLLTDWRARHGGIAMRLVRGNHDKRAGDPPSAVGIECVDGPLLEPPFALAHHPAQVDGAYVLAGHVHPCAVLVGRGRQRERLPCFWLGERTGVLPAFGEFTGCAEVTPSEGDAVWVVAGDEVMRFEARVS